VNGYRLADCFHDGYVTLALKELWCGKTDRQTHKILAHSRQTVFEMQLLASPSLSLSLSLSLCQHIST
jgi:hypothetical protein